MDHKSLLKQLGGEHAVCAELTNRGVEVAPVTVRAWALPGRAIPAKYWLHLIDIAKSAGVPLTLEQLAEDAAAPLPADTPSPQQDAA